MNDSLNDFGVGIYSFVPETDIFEQKCLFIYFFIFLLFILIALIRALLGTKLPVMFFKRYSTKTE